MFHMNSFIYNNITFILALLPDWRLFIIIIFSGCYHIFKIVNFEFIFFTIRKVTLRFLKFRGCNLKFLFNLFGKTACAQNLCLQKICSKCASKRVFLKFSFSFSLSFSFLKFHFHENCVNTNYSFASCYRLN